MTLVWFVVWPIADEIGGEEPVSFDRVNWWTGALIRAIAPDIGRQHAGELPSRRAA